MDDQSSSNSNRRRRQRPRRYRRYHSQPTIPLILVEVIPLLTVDDDDRLTTSGNDNNNVQLTNYSVKHFLSTRRRTYRIVIDYECISYLHIIEKQQKQQQKHPHRQNPLIVSGYLADYNNDTGGDIIYDHKDENDKNDDEEQEGQPSVTINKEQRRLRPPRIPIMNIPSNDPLSSIEWIPCLVRGYIHHRNHNTFDTEEPLMTTAQAIVSTMTSSTLVRVLEPCPISSATLCSSSSPSLSPSRFLSTLLGEDPILTSNNKISNNRYDDILQCYDDTVIEELSLRLKRIGSKTIRIGTTNGALSYYRRQHHQHQSLINHLRRRAQHSSSSEPISAIPSSSKSKSESDSSLWWSPSLIVHSPYHNDGKTALVQTILRDKINASAIHMIHIGPLLAKYGSRTDVALETQIHTAIVSAACRYHNNTIRCDDDNDDDNERQSLPPPLCAIIIDQLELFVPSRMSGKNSGSGGDDTTTVPVLNAIVSYFRTITSSMKRLHGEFPFPTKNPLYNYNYNVSSSSGVGQPQPQPPQQWGHVLPVRICLVGIVTCPDDGWKSKIQQQKQQQSTSSTLSSMGGNTIFEALGSGGDRYRLPMLSDQGRFIALERLFHQRGLQLDSNATSTLKSLSTSCQWVKGGMIQHIVTELQSTKQQMKSTSTKNNNEKKKKIPPIVVTDHDLVQLFENVRRKYLDVTITNSISTTMNGVVSTTSPPSTTMGDGRNNTTSTSDSTSTTQRQLDPTSSSSSSKSSKSSSSFFFDSVGGATQAKVALVDALALDETKRELLHRFGLHPPTGVLLYGPPGTGKTLLAKAVANLLGEGNANNNGGKNNNNNNTTAGGKFISMSISDVVSSEVGTSEKTILSTFEYADQNAPAVIFMDEFQALFTDRSSGGTGRLTTTLLQCLDDIQRWQQADEYVEGTQQLPHFYESTTTTSRRHRRRRGVTVIAATNTPWMIDTAFLRQGRFDRVVHVGLPTSAERESIFMVHARRMKIKHGGNSRSSMASDKSTGDDENLPIDEASLLTMAQFVASRTDGYSGADVAAMCRAAAVRSLVSSSEDASAKVTQTIGVTQEDFRIAIEEDIRPSSDEKLIQRLSEWRPML